mmetsp:Transcript_67030/g.151509  ORF Transcript_67030/g.151509 Transcript_67030/m.151509 type:complete len:304 (-) Transcript_67030:175-1086(-)
MPRKDQVTGLPAARSHVTALARLMGTAKPIELALRRIMVLTPTTSPNSLIKGPPLFPGLIAASVWMRVPLRLIPASILSTLLDEALHTPKVTVFSSPKGDPIAITQSPASSESESPSWTSGNRAFLAAEVPWAAGSLAGSLAPPSPGGGPNKAGSSARRPGRVHPPPRKPARSRPPRPPLPAEAEASPCFSEPSWASWASAASVEETSAVASDSPALSASPRAISSARSSSSLSATPSMPRLRSWSRGSFRGEESRTTARSEKASVPRTAQSDRRRPSVRVTVTLEAPSTTWALVSTSPSRPS